MKNVLTIVGLIMSSMTLQAATVVWDSFSSEDHGSVLEISRWFGPYFQADIDLGVSGIGGGWYDVTFEGTSLAFSGNWLQGEYGMVIDASSTRGRPYTDYFVHADIDDGGYSMGTPIRVKKGDDFYLVFVVTDAGGPPDPSYIYGWVQLGVQSDGTLQLLGSALDLDGGPMIVGGGSASPEPTSALLLLLGAGVLGLRRRCPACSDSAKNASVSRPCGKIEWRLLSAYGAWIDS